MNEINFAKKTKKKKNELPPDPIPQRDVVVGTCPYHGHVKVWVDEAPGFEIPRCPIAAPALTFGNVKFPEIRCNSSLSLRLVRKPHNVSAA